jgi:hypothetical protein
MDFHLAHPYDRRLREDLDAIAPGLSDDLGFAAGLPEAQAERLVGLIIELACQCQNTRNITLGREAAAEVPRLWLLGRIEGVAERMLDLDDEWEYRRFLEVAELLDPGLLSRIISRGLTSGNAEVVEAAEDFALKDAAKAPVSPSPNSASGGLSGASGKRSDNGDRTQAVVGPRLCRDPIGKRTSRMHHINQT